MPEALYRVGKLAVRQVDLPFQPAGFFNELPEPEPEFCSFSLLFLKDILSDREFVVDSGASVSVFPGPKSTSSDGVRLLTFFLRFRIQALYLEISTCSCLCSSPRSGFSGAFQPSCRYQRSKGSTCTVSGGRPSLHLSFSSACFPPYILSLSSTSDPEASLGVPRCSQ